MARAKLNLTLISDEEAAKYLLTSLSRLNFGSGDKEVVIPPPPGSKDKPIVYKISSVAEHIQAWMNGAKDDVIAIREIKYAKKEMAIERSLGRKA